MLEWIIATALFAALVRYVWVSLNRPVPAEEFDTDLSAALDSIRAADPIDVRASDFAPLAAADKEVSRRARVPAITTPLPSMKGISK